MQVASFTSFFLGDPYIGGRSEELKKKGKRITELEQENRRLREQLRTGRTGGSAQAGSSGFVRRDMSALDKRAM